MKMKTFTRLFWALCAFSATRPWPSPAPWHGPLDLLAFVAALLALTETLDSK